MRSLALVLAVVGVLGMPSGIAPLSAASDTKTRSVTAHAEVASRTSLTVSTQLLQFSVSTSGAPAIATVDFVAGVRTPAGAEVMLTIEAGALQGLEGAANPDARVTFSGEEDGGLLGAVMAPQPTVAARWVGSGRRTGRIAFALRGAAAGTYTLPVRFVLTAP